MRILYFHQHFTTPNGGGGTRSYEFAKRLVAQKHKVTMICGRYKDGDTGVQGEFKNSVRSGNVDGIDIIEFDLPYANADNFLKRSMTFLRFSWKSIKIVLSYKYDLVFATSTPLTASLPGIFAKIFRKKPFVFEVRDLWPELPKAMGVIKNPIILKLLSILEWCSYHTANYCIGLAPGIVQGIESKGIAKQKIILIPNGCDTDLFLTENNSLRATLFTRKPNEFIAIFTGSHGIANGLDAVLNVAIELKKQKKDHIKFVFVGDGKKKPELIERAKQQQLNNCIFLPTIPKRELINLYQQADIGLMILKNVPEFYFGTSPNKFFDYIACGLPVVCNYPGWLAELITQYNCGKTVLPDDTLNFVNVLIDLATKREQLKKMSENASILATQTFHRDILANKFIEVLETCVTQ